MTKESKNATLSEKMANAAVETLNVSELAIIAAIKKGENTPSKIEAATSIKEPIVTGVLESLITRNYIIMVPGAEENSYMMKIQTSDDSKKMKLPGNLFLPVSSFTDGEGQRWVTRGAWHKIDADIDILNDIEWYSNSENDSQLKVVMKTVTEKKKRRNEEKAKTDIKLDAPATAEDLEHENKWHNISENMKMYVSSVSATRATVSFSARFITPQGKEFPFGCASERMVISIDDLHKYIANELPNPEIDFSKIMIITGKNNFPANFVSEKVGDIETVTKVHYFELKPNKDGSIKNSEFFLIFKEGGHSIKSGDVTTLNPEEVAEFVKTNCTLAYEFYNK